ncbi:MAG: hypothetical protein H6508_00390 [Calditrichaeota bacterium]|nr:hypothetical protein [Calditrichota bacterium]MCB9365631.1 hypothetical protein [Calditrichota bacterium]
MIRISLKGFAKYFCTSSAATRRKILADYKFPQPEGLAQAQYYEHARRAIVTFHERDNDERWMADRITSLRGSAVETENSRIRQKWNNNALALQRYLAGFGGKQFDVLPNTRRGMVIGDVRIGVFPDLHVIERSREKYIKIEYSRNPVEMNYVNVISQVMYECLIQDGQDIDPKDVRFFMLADNSNHKGARLRPRLRNDIVATCETIEALWPRITPPNR